MLPKTQRGRTLMSWSTLNFKLELSISNEDAWGALGIPKYMSDRHSA